MSMAVQIVSICLASNTAPPVDCYLKLQLSIEDTKLEQKRGTAGRERTRLSVVQGCVRRNAFVVDIDLMICNATNISSWVSLTVSGQSSEGQLINCWICAPPLGGGGHVTYRLTVHTGLSLGAEFFIRLS